MKTEDLRLRIWDWGVGCSTIVEIVGRTPLVEGVKVELSGAAQYVEPTQKSRRWAVEASKELVSPPVKR